MTTTCPDTATQPTTATTGGSAPTKPGLGVPVGLVVLLGAMQAIGPLSLDTYLPGLPSIAADLHASASATGLTLTATLAGLAAGQVVLGPLGDAVGRRRPLLVGLAAFVVAAVLCALAPSVEVLVVLRFLLGFSAAAGMVGALSIARDRASGTAMARLLAALMLVTGAAPVLSPVLGGQLLRLTSWRGIFGLLAVLGTFVWLAALLRVPETLPPHLRRRGGLGGTLRTFGALLRDRGYAGPLLALVLACGGLFGYLAGSPFLLQDAHGLSPQAYSAVFAVNTVGLVALSQLSGRVVDRVGPRVLLLAGTGTIAVGGTGLLAATLADAGLLGVLPALFLVVAGMGLVFPSATALALADHGDTAGSASALLGLGQFTSGAVVAPLVGLGGDTTVSMAVVIAVATLGALAATLAAIRPAGQRSRARVQAVR